jgi:hypothetical protein
LQVGVFPVFCLFLSFLVWSFLWLLDKVLTLLWVFLHRENRDFSILMKDTYCPLISCRLSEVYESMVSELLL